MFTAEQLFNFFETELLDPMKPLHLKVIVGSLLVLYGLLCSCKIMRLEVVDVLDGLDK